MIEILSLPRRRSQNVHVSNITFKSGLPINSLPGWEHIPLNLKLPMLKCPGNEVIFSKDKIGESLRDLKHEFDISGRDSFPEYNPLHDSNLKSFYANERNLKRLRENGEITQDNDVICNLKDFNEYRQQLHKSQLYYILKELNRTETDQHDRLLIANAENITKKYHSNLVAREHTYSEILQRKSCIDHKKSEHYRKLYEKTLEKFSYVQMLQTLKLATAEYNKTLHQLKLQKHWDVRNDLERKHLISLKKLYQFKKERLRKNLRKLQESRTQEAQEKEIASWNKRLEERITNQEKIDILLQQANEQKKIFIDNHKSKYQVKWLKLQDDIKKRSLKNRKNRSVPKKESQQLLTNDNRISYGAEFQNSFEQLLENDVCKIVNTALDLENQTKVPFEPDDPIYKAAQFIMQHILAKFHKDLSTNIEAYQSVYQRLELFFNEAKKLVIFRSTQIIASFQQSIKHQPNGSPAFKRTSTGRVSFSRMPSTIGMSSYQINPLIEVREVADRKPTPAGSLASLVVDSTASLVEKTHTNSLCRNELVFIEHYLTKFKRELIVGIGRRVFAAIQCHFNHKIMDVRQELLDIDRKFLIKQVTQSILSYAINPLNFESNLRLCISALSSDIIWSLQKQLLKPSRDTRRMVKPCIKCCFRQDNKKLCLFCRGEEWN